MSRFTPNSVLGLGTGRASVPLTDLLLNFSDIIGPSTSKVRLLSTPTLGDSLDSLGLWKNFVTYQTAFWKVFKPLLDEQRGTFFGQNFSNTEPLLPIVSSTTSLLGQVQKNAPEAFASLLALRVEPTLRATASTLDVYSRVPSFCFPFNLSFESDSIRYSWFDWYSTRNSVITKALDTSVFNLHGAKDYAFTFNSAVANLAAVNRYENYFLKYSLARKFYLPHSTYRPFFLDLARSAYRTGTRTFGTGSGFNQYQAYLRFLPLGSNVNSVGPSWSFAGALNQTRPFTESVTYSSNPLTPSIALFDVSARREYILRSLGARGADRSLAKLQSIVAAFGHTTRPAPALTLLNPYYTSAADKWSTLDTAPAISQYRPLRKGIVNMIRIQADKAIAMPTDTRLQILAVSKDIIHSWSIPSAGIKIDCIPGYSSHRVAIFTVSGIYWGQCMEICGRFHHWMPIVVYFLRRDLFCLWCIHFIFKNNQTNGTLQSLNHGSMDSNIVVAGNVNVWNYVS